jgi:uncharacterized iron-regulated membrane protein
MSTAGGFWRRPQALPWRRALFQVHLWSGLAIGLYIVCLSLSGSAIVFRREVDKALCPQIIRVHPIGLRLSDAQLRAAAERVFQRVPRFNAALVQVRGPRVPGAAIEIWYLFGNGRGRVERLIDPYSGRDLGDTVACEPVWVSRIADLHDDLLGGDTGTAFNGVGATLLTLMCLTGAVIWWPGHTRWRRSLSVHRQVGWRRFTWDLHSMLGFWLFALLLLWAFSGIYLAFPDSFYNAAGFLAAHGIGPQKGHRFDLLIDWLVRLHFGRTFGTGVKVLWVVLGLAPAALTVTGTLMWWNRVVRRSVGRSGEVAAASQAASSAVPTLAPSSLPGTACERPSAADPLALPR